MEVNEKFCVMTKEDELMVDGGIAPINCPLCQGHFELV